MLWVDTFLKLCAITALVVFIMFMATLSVCIVISVKDERRKKQ